MYTKVYFILAHTKPEQIMTLISLLQDKKSFFFIHLDKKVNINSFESLIQVADCHFIKNRVKCKWGNYSLVKATLNGMMEIQNFMKVNNPYVNYHCIFLSGEDLPLKKNEFIHDFLINRQETSFINHWKLPYDKWWRGGGFRFESLYFLDFNKHPKAHYWMNKIIRKLNLHFVLPINRIKNGYPDLELYGSSQWVILSKKVMELIIEVSNTKPLFSKLFKYVMAPDELYIPTLIHYFHKKEFFTVENIATHLIIFKGYDANPQYLSIEDIENNKVETILFARKFDDAINGDAIAYIKNILK